MPRPPFNIYPFCKGSCPVDKDPLFFSGKTFRASTSCIKNVCSVYNDNRTRTEVRFPFGHRLKKEVVCMNRAPLMTGEELRMVKDALLLPLMLDVLQRDMDKMVRAKLKLDRLYITSLRKVQDDIHAEMTGLRRELKVRGIRIYEEIREPEGIRAKYKCRGYDRVLFLLWDKVRTDLLAIGSRHLRISLAQDGDRTP